MKSSVPRHIATMSGTGVTSSVPWNIATMTRTGVTESVSFALGYCYQFKNWSDFVMSWNIVSMSGI